MCVANEDGQITTAIVGVPSVQKRQWLCLTFRGQAEGRAKLRILELMSRSPAELIWRNPLPAGERWGINC